MAGIYIHIPFCTQKCHYCNFHFSTSLAQKHDLVNALLQEIDLQKNYLENESIETVYFGGGTPSLLSEKELNWILNSIQKKISLSAQAEITLEANPGDLTTDYLNILKNAGVNRLSIGIQSFDDEDLKRLNRNHSSQEGIASVKRAQDSGMKNISIDLIYGLPEMNLTKWKKNLAIAFTLDVPHLSSYCLTIEKNTFFYDQKINKKISFPEDEITAEQFEELMKETAENGFLHYEISNFCKPDFFSKHNSSYWKNIPYLGIGPSAHSYNRISRQWNVANNSHYIKSLQEKNIPFEKENLTTIQKFNERILTGIRTMWGVDENELRKNFTKKFIEEFKKQTLPYLESGHLNFNENIYSLSQKGKLVADRITSDLFLDDDIIA
jgi:oxygen-independent coproporphyrinogen III oxidase